MSNAKPKTAEEEKVLVRFKDYNPEKLPNGKLSKPPEKLSFGNGEFRRTFEAKDQPFAVTIDQAEMLKRSGLFVDAEAPANPDNSENANAETETPVDPAATHDVNAETEEIVRTKRIKK